MAQKVSFTAGRIAELKCPPGVDQHLLWDSRCPWLAVRITAAGSKSFIFQSKLKGKTIRMTIGSVAAWQIEAARQAATEKKTLIDRGVDPRKAAVHAAQAPDGHGNEGCEQAILVGEAWVQYLANGKPRRKKAWKPRYVQDLKEATAPGGVPRLRGKGVTKPGPLYPLLSKRLVDIDEDAMRDWYREQAKRGDTVASRALAMFSGFLSWCSKQREYKKLVQKDAAKPSAFSDLLPPTVHRTDALQASQLPAWFRAADQELNRIGSTYLIGLLLTGARRDELARLKHQDMDLTWNQMTVADKYGETRDIPLTPYLKKLIAELPRMEGNPYVFWNSRSASGHIAEPRSVLDRLLKAAGVGHVTIHGLRRSFSKLGEAARVPLGAIAQIMGHQPSALAEWYRWREMDELRGYAIEIEEFILRKAGMVAGPGLPNPGEQTRPAATPAARETAATV